MTGFSSAMFREGMSPKMKKRIAEFQNSGSKLEENIAKQKASDIRMEEIKQLREQGKSLQENKIKTSVIPARTIGKLSSDLVKKFENSSIKPMAQESLEDRQKSILKKILTKTLALRDADLIRGIMLFFGAEGSDGNVENILENIVNKLNTLGEKGEEVKDLFTEMFDIPEEDENKLKVSEKISNIITSLQTREEKESSQADEIQAELANVIAQRNKILAENNAVIA